MPYGTHEITFNPFTFAYADDVDYLSNLLANQGVAARFNLYAHRRRGAWSCTVPVGTFDNDFRENACSWDQHIASRDRITKLACADLPKNHRAIPHRYDVLVHEDRSYYHPEALRVYARYVEHPAFLRALYSFLEAAEQQPQLIVPPRPRAPFVPLTERPAVYGHPARGPDWTSEEDQILRQWFGQRTVGEHAGKHVKLTEEEWSIVLGLLPRRNKTGVRGRIVELNRRLQTEFFRDGFLGKHRLREYMSRVLGERPRIPLRPTRRRPRPSALL